MLFASAFPGMFNTYVRRVFQRTYDALLAAPVSVDELALAEAAGSRPRPASTAPSR